MTLSMIIQVRLSHLQGPCDSECDNLDDYDSEYDSLKVNKA